MRIKSHTSYNEECVSKHSFSCIPRWVYIFVSLGIYTRRFSLPVFLFQNLLGLFEMSLLVPCDIQVYPDNPTISRPQMCLVWIMNESLFILSHTNRCIHIQCLPPFHRESVQTNCFFRSTHTNSKGWWPHIRTGHKWGFTPSCTTISFYQNGTGPPGWEPLAFVSFQCVCMYNICKGLMKDPYTQRHTHTGNTIFRGSA